MLGAPEGVPILYYEDLEPGHEQHGGSAVVDRDEMIDYARGHDPWPFHVDEAAAKESVFGELVASGGYSINMWFKLGHQLLNDTDEFWAFMGGLEWKIKFAKGVRAGETLHFMRRVAGKRPSSKPGRGILFVESRLTNQDGEVVLNLEEVVLVRRRPGSSTD